uniref:LGFP repeat-containing protein n=1 Tax=Geodermatophilus amargosae TaxID=1296565 RepID=UPI0034DFDB4A
VAGILETWIRQGYETGPLGYPVSNETPTPTGGSYNAFQHGAVYWSPATGAHWLTGPVFDAWAAQGREGGPLGYPAGDLGRLPGGGSFAWFQGGAVYASPATGAHVLSGPILHAWIAQGFETGPLGYPTSDPHPVPGGTAVDFQGGTLTVDATGTVTSSRSVTR